MVCKEIEWGSGFFASKSKDNQFVDKTRLNILLHQETLTNSVNMTSKLWGIRIAKSDITITTDRYHLLVSVKFGHQGHLSVYLFSTIIIDSLFWRDR